MANRNRSYRSYLGARGQLTEKVKSPDRSDRSSAYNVASRQRGQFSGFQITEALHWYLNCKYLPRRPHAAASSALFIETGLCKLNTGPPSAVRVFARRHDFTTRPTPSLGFQYPHSVLTRLVFTARLTIKVPFSDNVDTLVALTCQPMASQYHLVAYQFACTPCLLLQGREAISPDFESQKPCISISFANTSLDSHMPPLRLRYLMRQDFAS